MLELSAIILLAYLLDLVLGDPRYPYHPVRLIGTSISSMTKRLHGIGLNGKGGGILLVCITLAWTLGLYLVLHLVLGAISPLLGFGFDLFVCYSLLALKDLIVHIRPVISALETDRIVAAREAIAMTVGRDVRYLDREGISRAAIETLTENFVDGFLAPLFWYVTGGWVAGLLNWPPPLTAGCLMLAFKVANTLDSMVGYKTGPFLEFGWAGARLDDLANFIPARLSLFILSAAAALIGLHARDGMKVALRDRLKHESPNSAHAESFAAGALHVRLGGPTRYADGLKMKPWLGESFADPGPWHVAKAVLLIKYAAALAIPGSLCALLVIHWLT